MMNHITEIIPDNLPDRWADAMERGQLFRELLAEIERLKTEIEGLKVRLEAAHDAVEW